MKNEFSSMFEGGHEHSTLMKVLKWAIIIIVIIVLLVLLFWVIKTVWDKVASDDSELVAGPGYTVRSKLNPAYAMTYESPLPLDADRRTSDYPITQDAPSRFNDFIRHIDNLEMCECRGDCECSGFTGSPSTPEIRTVSLPKLDEQRSIVGQAAVARNMLGCQ